MTWRDCMNRRQVLGDFSPMSRCRPNTNILRFIVQSLPVQWKVIFYSTARVHSSDVYLR